MIVIYLKAASVAEALEMQAQLREAGVQSPIQSKPYVMPSGVDSEERKAIDAWKAATGQSRFKRNTDEMQAGLSVAQAIAARLANMGGNQLPPDADTMEDDGRDVME